VNFVAHASVALAALGPRPDAAAVAFGAALPDLASMMSLRIDRLALPAPVGEGVALHHRMDSGFHALPEFTSGSRHLRESLRARGLAIGPSRAIGHAGWELLLDGSLLDRDGVEESFDRVLELAPDVALAVSPGDPDRWRGLVLEMRSGRWWLGYRDPELVAHRLQRRLQSRRLLSFAPDQIPFVADALAAAKPAVDSVTDHVLATVIALISTPDPIN
jgi:hypothetical protein